MGIARSITVVESAPAGDVRRLSNVGFIVIRQTDRQHVRLEGQQGLVESQQGQVVLEGPRVELRVTRHDLHPSFLITVGLVLVRQIVLTDSQQQIARRYAARCTMRD